MGRMATVIETKDIIIGVLNDTGQPISAEELKLELQSTAFTAKQYCDFRYSTNLTRFFFDPYTGKRIDWKEIYNYLVENKDPEEVNA